MFYISKYISNTWHKRLANAVSSIKSCFNVEKWLMPPTLKISWVFNVKSTLIQWFGFQSWNFNVDSTLNIGWSALQLQFNHSSMLKQRYVPTGKHVHWLTGFAENFDTVYSKIELYRNLFKHCDFFLSPSLFFLVFCFKEVVKHI